MEEKIITAIAETLHINAEEITRDKAIKDIPEWDSLMFLMILSRLKDDFDIDIPMDKAIAMETVRDILAFAVTK